jgi:hypothetical protein
MIEKELAVLRANPQFVSLYLEGMSALFRSGVFGALRLIGRPIILEKGKDVHCMATQAAWSSGFNDAIDMLMNFKEKFIDVENKAEEPRMDFGGLDYALQRGDISKEEADAIRSGKPIVASDITAKGVSSAANK